MSTFSPSVLQPRHAILSGLPDAAALEILLRPFLRDGEIVDTAIRLDGIALPSLRLGDLAGQRFDFPRNPHAGYIDGSLYLDGAHHPVDVDMLTFNLARDGQLTLVAKGVYAFDVEGLGDLGKVPFTLAARVSSCAL
ncbi:hypothetical protein FHR56_003492 [Xanthomonas sacchari]|uniref:hypothetical protein n=1 Tax=unclassified Xanthomonas TaxID=2643310 RepID=UPI00137158C1|nr:MULTISPECIES: hypothetical protein [unclassified Xanthomonas]MBB6368313.1 hypothetical protein [Xanthomonas sp. F10]MXV33195.1 hypothetical protein [Xanthomonas sp. LMG 8989]